MTRRQKFTVTLFMILATGVIVNTGAFFLRSTLKKNSLEYRLISPLADPVKASKQVLSSLTKEPIKEIIDRSQQGTKGTYAIVIKNFASGDTYYTLERKQFMSASLYKLWIMAVTVDLIEKGKLKESDTLARTIPSLNAQFRIASESAELKEGNISMTVGQALHKMITVSHNYAALLLSDKVGLKNVTTFLKDNGFSESSIGQPPKTSAADTAKFFEKLYNGELISKTASEKMLSLLKQQEWDDRIPKYLPEEIDVAHKTGELEYVKHDAGIVFSPKGDYIFVVLSETNNPKAAAERIASLSKAVYEYFQVE